MKCFVLNGNCKYWCELTVFCMYVREINLDLDVCMCVGRQYRYTTLPHSVPWKAGGDSPPATRPHRNQDQALNASLPQKEPESAGPRAEARKTPEALKVLLSRKVRKCSKMDGEIPKRHRSQFKGVPTDRIKDDLSIIRLIMNLTHGIETYESRWIHNIPPYTHPYISRHINR